MLKENDLVKYTKQDDELDAMGFVLNQIYQVTIENDHYLVKSGLGYRCRECLQIKNQPTYAAQFFTEHTCLLLKVSDDKDTVWGELESPVKDRLGESFDSDQFKETIRKIVFGE